MTAWAMITLFVKYVLGLSVICAALVGIFKFYKMLRPHLNNAIKALHARINKPVSDRLDLISEILTRIETGQREGKHEMNFLTVAQKATMENQGLTWWRSDSNGRTIEVPRQTCELLGLQEQDLLEGGWLNHIKQSERDDVLRAMSYSLEHKTPYDIEASFKMGDGHFERCRTGAKYTGLDWFGIILPITP